MRYHQTRADVDANVSYSHAEVNAGLICASLPTLRPLIRRFFPVLLPGSSGDEPSAPKGVVVLDERGHMTRYELKSFRRIKSDNKTNKVEPVLESENASEEHILSEGPSSPTWGATAEKGKV